MNLMRSIGTIAVLLLIAGVGILSGRKVRSNKDFESGGQRAKAGIVSGIMMGTLIGGASTIGTAQLAYHYGIAACWYTIGGGLGCLTIALLYVRLYRKNRTPTLIGIIREEYGAKAGTVASVLVCVSMFLNVIAQLFSSTAVIPTLFPGLSLPAALALAAVLMLIYVVFGGVFGAGQAGQVKTLLVYLSIIAGAVIALKNTGIHVLLNKLNHAVYFNMFSRGAWDMLTNTLAVILGVVTTQTQMQAILTGKSEQIARRGAIISAVLIPPIGFGSAIIGMFMRVNHPELLNAKDALPQFILNYMPDLAAGVVMGTLLIAIVGLGAGIVLGIGTIMTNDLIIPAFRRPLSSKETLLCARGCIAGLLLVGCFLSTGTLGDIILNFATMSMGLRASIIFAPFMCAVFLPGKVCSRWIMAAFFCGPGLVLLFELWRGLPFGPLFAGILGSAICCVVGFLKRSKLIEK